MTLQKVIDRVTRLRSERGCDTDFIIEKINEIEWKIKREIIDVHEGSERYPFDGYTSDELDVRLIAPEPYSGVYVKFVLYQIDVMNNDMINATNSLALYNEAYESFAAWYRRNNMPICKGNMKSGAYHI